METITQAAIIGIEVSSDWLDIHCLPSNQRHRLPHTYEGHVRLGELAGAHNALVCFEATGGQEWRLWSALDAKGVATRQLLPAPIKAHEKLGSADLFKGMDAELKELLGRQLKEIEARIEQTIGSDNERSATASILRSVPGIGPVASTMLIAEIPNSVISRANKRQQSRALRQLPMTAEPCAASAS